MGLHWNAKLQRDIYIVQPGECYLAQGDELVNTVLGSCIAVCLRDSKNKVGGMNHFILPSNNLGTQLHWPDNFDSKSLRYGDISMALLINELIKNGAEREYFEAKVFGGAAVLPAQTDIGANNIRFVHEYLSLEEIAIFAEDVGGSQGRKIYYDVQTGEVLRKLIPESEAMKVKTRETDYLEKINNTDIDGKIYFLDDNL